MGIIRIILTTPVPLWLVLLLLVFVAAVMLVRGVLNEDKLRDALKKIYNGKLLRINDLPVNVGFRVLGITASDEGRVNPRFAMAELEGMKNRGDAASQAFGVTFAFSKVADEKGNFLFKAGDTIKVTPRGNIEVMRVSTSLKT